MTQVKRNRKDESMDRPISDPTEEEIQKLAEEIKQKNLIAKRASTAKTTPRIRTNLRTYNYRGNGIFKVQ